ncbi:MAG TPA: glycosyltransferase family 4 protein [Rhodocyclaceae bacterium]|nr:glycosyltransferase family 4 protein [Rhodocyclaceae bacterium]
MRIAIVAPLMESVPPKLYGGTERIVSYLTEELVHQGHDVTLFASGDSVTCADLRPITDKGLRLDPDCRDPFAHYAVMLDEVAHSAGQFDVIHFNIDYLHFPLVRHLGLRTVTTLHGRQDIPDLAPLYRHFADLPVVSISDAQRRPLPWANWIATVPHGLPRKLYGLHAKPGSYLAFLGRMSPEKRPDRAIRIARRAGLPLKMAAKVEKGPDECYFDEHIRPLLREPGVEFVGEIGEAEKNDFLGNALALLFPIDWPEPFGLVMIEAMACGTPVIAWPCGSVPEVVREGVSGFVVDSEDEAVAAIERCHTLDREKCRRDFEKRFSSERMARDYVRVYRRLLADSPSTIEA